MANMFAFSSDRPDLVEEVADDLSKAGHFGAVWRPHDRWVLGETPLPYSSPDTGAARSFGLAFVEGRDRVLRRRTEHDDGARLIDRLRRVPRALDQLEGDFGFVWFERDGSAVAVRSCGGRVPLYIWADDHSVAVSTLLRGIAAFVPGDPDIDPLALATWTTRWAFTPDDRTFVAGARLLPPGCLAAVRPGTTGTPFDRYWDPRPERPAKSNPHRLDDLGAELRSLLVAHLVEELHPDEGNLASISGGVDSSSLATLTVGAAGRPISTTISFIAPSGPDRARELGYIRPLLDAVGPNERIYADAGSDAFDRLYRAATPSLIPCLHPVLCSVASLSAHSDVRTYLGGEYCDDLFGVFLAGDWYEAVGVGQALRPQNIRMRGRMAAARWMRHRAAAILGRPQVHLPERLPEFLQPPLEVEYQRWRQHYRERIRPDRRPWRHTWARRSSGVGWLEMNWELASPLGVRRVFPFATRQVLELAMTCPPVDVLADGSKTILRRGLMQDVPRRYLFRPDKGRLSPTVRQPVRRPSIVPMATRVLDMSWVEGAPDLVAPEVGWPILHLVQSVEEWRCLRSARRLRIGRR